MNDFKNLARWAASLTCGAGLLVACGTGEEADEDPAVREALCAGATERCVDEFGAEICPADSGWAGDDLALCEPEEGKGLLFHYGPSDYDDPEEIAKYTLAAGAEDENCVFIRTPNDEEVYLRDFHGRMRPGSHHLIVTLVDEYDGPFNEPVSCSQNDAVGSRWLLGSQDPQIDLASGGVDASLDVPAAKEGDPDYKTGIRLPANQILRIDMHYINTSSEEVLRESWVSLDIVPKDDVETFADMITFFQGAIDIPPMSEGVETSMARCKAPTDRYVALLTGHFHENGTRFSVWHEKGDGSTDLVYQTHDWEDPGNLTYVDRADNPEVDPNEIDHGGSSGYLLVKEGESLNFQCQFDNPTDTSVGLGDQGRDQMCNVFGMYYPSDGDVWGCQCLGSICF